jgi:long-subunit acyl-CoA synthetase (AMP-forming)
LSIRPRIALARFARCKCRAIGACALDDEALILFTSGTTGNPKGVVPTHRSLLARWTGPRQSLGVETFHRTLCLLPTHFGHGLICNSLFPWLSGQTLIVIPPIQATAWRSSEP